MFILSLKRIDLHRGDVIVSVAFMLPIQRLRIACVLHARQTVSACMQSNRCAEENDKTWRQLLEKANRKALDADAAAERYVQTAYFLMLSVLCSTTTAHICY